jgi:hypothetical protein
MTPDALALQREAQELRAAIEQLLDRQGWSWSPWLSQCLDLAVDTEDAMHELIGPRLVVCFICGEALPTYAPPSFATCHGTPCGEWLARSGGLAEVNRDLMVMLESRARMRGHDPAQPVPEDWALELLEVIGAGIAMNHQPAAT